jgi:hypothetical protein
MSRQNWMHVSHAPEWVAAPLKINAEGDTRPGYLCIHDLENGNGLCGSNWFEPDPGEHTCVVPVRGRWNISRPCYDKHHRCPGWAGGGMKFAKKKFCYTGGSLARVINYDDPWWRWKTHKCPECGVVVLPYMIRYTSPREWWWKLRHARSSWMWLYKLETRLGKWRGKW